MLSLSVIMPVYNGESFIAEALSSIHSQEHADYEIIVIDDGSTDETARIVQNIGNVRYVFQENQGPQHARNHGLSLAKGQLIAFLDADDVWASDKLQKQIHRLENADIVLGLSRILNDSESLPFILPSLSCALFHRSAFDLVGNFDSDLYYSDDLDWYMRARELGLRFTMHRDVVLFHRRHEHNLTRNAQKKQHYQLLMLMKSIARRKKLGMKPLPKFSDFFDEQLESE